MNGGITHSRLVSQLRAAGVPRSRHLLVHCAMSRVGRIVGGADTLLRAIHTAAGPDATIVVPVQTPDNSTTSRAYHRATAGMSAAQRAAYEARMTGFDPDHTPSYRMGALAEHVRRHPDAVRSGHPQTSFSAIGPDAATLMSGHAWSSHLGEESPLAALYRAGAFAVLIGVGIDQCTALHLAEYRLQPPVPSKTYTCFVRGESGVERRTFDAPDLDDSDFGRMGAAMSGLGWLRTGLVGDAPTSVLPIAQAVDFAIGWMSRNRPSLQPV